MGFFDFLDRAVKSGVQAMKDKQASLQRYMDKYDHYDDNDLIRRFQETSGDEKLAIGMLLKQRGYGNND